MVVVGYLDLLRRREAGDDCYPMKKLSGRTARRFRRYGSKGAHQVHDFAEHRAEHSQRVGRENDSSVKESSTSPYAPASRKLYTSRISLRAILTRRLVVMMKLFLDSAMKMKRNREGTLSPSIRETHEERKHFFCVAKSALARVYANVGT